MALRELVGFVVAGFWISGWANAQVTIEEPWIRATAPGQTVAGAYMKIKSSKRSALVAVSTPLTATAEIHEMSMEAGVMKMRAVPKLDLPPGKTIELKPGGYHLMFRNIRKPLREGEIVPITLVFEGPGQKREQLHIQALVRALSAGVHGGPGMRHSH